MGSERTDRGRELFDVVTRYAAIGQHRTGTPADARTIEWFRDLVLAAGASRVEILPYRFERYEASFGVCIGGAEVPAFPLFYEGFGTVCTRHPAIASIDTRLPEGSLNAWLAEFTGEALRAGAAAGVLATRAPGGRLCAINRPPGRKSGLPTLCVAGAESGRLRTEPIELWMKASRHDGSSANVLARFGDPDDPRPVMVTTPLSGWFECAGERGTGIAIAVALAAELAGRYTVVLAATTGHELGYLGAKHLAAAGAVEPHAVIHIGSSIAAAGEPDAASGLGLTPEIDVILNPASGREAIRQMSEPLGVTVRAPPVATDPGGWQGESECWAHLGVPMISIAGYAPLFHTRDDVPASATSPSLMAEMCSVWAGVVNLFLERSVGSSQR
jgi:hypothetical protein